MSDYLPPQVLIDILSRLPVESLLRLRCVCKTWSSLISSPDFIATHFNRTSPSTAHHLLRHFSIDQGTERYSLRSADEAFTELRQLHCPFKTLSDLYFRFVGSCNGLICLSDDCFGYNYTIIIWNPAIRRCITLPKPKVCFDDYGPYMFALGFGVDPSSNDPKVVRIAYLAGSTPSEGWLAPPKVEVYAVSTGKWKTIRSASSVRYHLVETFWSKVFVNGSVHWVAYNRNGGSFCNVILLFDLGSEVFREMGLPEKLVGEFPIELTVAEYEDTISVFHYNNRGRSACGTCHVWIMKDYGVFESWVTLFTVQVDGGISTVVGFKNNGELLIEMWNNELVSYQPQSSRTKPLGVCGGRDSFHLDTYTESLVLHDAANGVLKKQVKPCDTVDCGNERVLSKEKKEALKGELDGSSGINYFLAALFLKY